MLISHGLVFMFASTIGGILLISQCSSGKKFVAAVWPYLILLFTCCAYFLVSRQMNIGMSSYLAHIFTWGVSWTRIPKLFLCTISSDSGDFLKSSSYILMAVVMAIVLMPWLMGLRINWQKKSTWIPFAVVLAIMLAVPAFAFSTAFLYQRFALFLLPAYAWMFTRNVASDLPDVKPAANTLLLQSRLGARLALPLLIILCLSILSVKSISSWKFGHETADIDSIISTLEPKHRAANLLFYRDSVADGNAKIYAHYPAWYQAEKQGLVDFNFAWFPPQIVRYRPDHLPAITPEDDWRPDRFGWLKNRGSDYTYFFVRQIAEPGKAMPKDLFKGADCRPEVLIKRGSWTVFKQQNCALTKQ